MLQNVVANTPFFGNVLNLYRQTRKVPGQPIAITLREYVALLAQQAQVVDSAKIRTGCNARRSAAIHETEYESNAHDFDPDDDADLDLDTILEVNVTSQRDPKTGRYLGNKGGNKSTGFKKGSEPEAPSE